MHFTRCLIPNLSATMSTRWRRLATPTWYNATFWNWFSCYVL
jgi:hypothetical protein